MLFNIYLTLILYDLQHSLQFNYSLMVVLSPSLRTKIFKQLPLNKSTKCFRKIKIDKTIFDF